MNSIKHLLSLIVHKQMLKRKKNIQVISFQAFLREELEGSAGTTHTCTIIKPKRKERTRKDHEEKSTKERQNLHDSARGSVRNKTTGRF